MRYSEMLDGRSEHLPVSELAGGARIRHIFLDIFVNGLQELNPSRRALPPHLLRPSLQHKPPPLGGLPCASRARALALEAYACGRTGFAVNITKAFQHQVVGQAVFAVVTRACQHQVMG